MANGQFEVTDYVIFSLSLALSASIGIYFTFWGSKKKTDNDYLYGDRKMKGIPVGLSLYSSAISALTIVGVPMEIYYYGLQYMIGLIGMLASAVIICYVLLPIFCGNLDIKTPYEYFERRFGVKVKILSTVIYLVHTFLMMPLIIYTPSMALSQVTQIPVLACSTLIGGICILYTAFGGFKSVVWTDTFQATLMLISCLIIAILGVNAAGGRTKVWSQALDGGRVKFFDMNPDPFQRTTFWTALIGTTFGIMVHLGCSVGALQRYMSLENPREAKLSVFIGCGSLILISCIGAVMGLAMYAVYHSCDPFLHKDISTPNQILPFFLTNSIGAVPGLSGFFIAGVLCAALSTLSSELNAVGGIIYFDIVLKIYKNNYIESNGPFIMKIIVLITGVLYLSTIPLVHLSSNLYELNFSVTGITYGAKLGIIFLAILYPRCNSKGAMTGAFASMIIMTWICYAANSYKVNSYYILDIKADNCSSSIFLNETIATAINSTVPTSIRKPKLEDIFILYRLSYQYYCLFGTLITVVVAIIVSYFTESSHLRTLDPLLITPFLRPYLLKKQPTA